MTSAVLHCHQLASLPSILIHVDRFVGGDNMNLASQQVLVFSLGHPNPDGSALHAALEPSTFYRVVLFLVD